MVLSEVYRVENIVPNLASKTKDELFDELVDFLAARRYKLDRDKVLVALRTREQMLSTAVAPHIALPHASLRGQKETIGVFGISKGGIEYGSHDGNLVHVVMMLVDDRLETKLHLGFLRQAAELVGSPDFYAKIMACSSAGEIFKVIVEVERMQRV